MMDKDFFPDSGSGNNVLMANVRVYEVAKTHKVTSQTVLDWLAENGWPVPSASSTLTQEQERAFKAASVISGSPMGLMMVPGREVQPDRVVRQTVQGACLCCGIQGMPAPSAKAPDELPMRRPVICRECSMHLGEDSHTLKRKNDKHLEMWRSELSRSLDAAKTACESQASRLNAEIEKKNRELAERPEVVVYENLDQEVVNEALHDRNIAFRHRDGAFATLSLVKGWHRAAMEKKCWCGELLTRCRTYELVSSDEALANWETNQYARYRSRQRHALPSGHRALTDPHWRPDDWRPSQWGFDN